MAGCIRIPLSRCRDAGAAVTGTAAVRDLLVSLLASLVTGVSVWLAQRLLRSGAMQRKRAFFGLARNQECLLAVSRHHASPHHLSVHRRDVAALVELATIARDCGAQADLVADDTPVGVGRITEFCVGGPDTNARMAAHLRAFLPGVLVEPHAMGADPAMSIGTTTFRRVRDQAEYVLLARAFGPGGARPVFLVCGQTARTNLAAARFLAARYRRLLRTYGASKRFCLVLRVVEPTVYGADFTEPAADLTAAAFSPPIVGP
jgi:hypothetical protein